MQESRKLAPLHHDRSGFPLDHHQKRQPFFLAEEIRCVWQGVNRPYIRGEVGTVFDQLFDTCVIVISYPLIVSLLSRNYHFVKNWDALIRYSLKVIDKRCCVKRRFRQVV